MKTNIHQKNTPPYKKFYLTDIKKADQRGHRQTLVLNEGN